MQTLRVETRGLTKSARSNARRMGKVPAVLYGKGLEPVAIMVGHDELRSALKQGARNQLIRLEGPTTGESHTVLIKDMAWDEVHSQFIHIDFFQPAEGKPIRVRVPVRVYGEDELTRRALILSHQLNEVECNCMPNQVPAAIHVDVSAFEAGTHISLGDLMAPDGVQIVGNPDMVVLNIEAPMQTMVPDLGAVDVTTAG